MDKYPRYAPQNGKRCVHAHMENLAGLLQIHMKDIVQDYINKKLIDNYEDYKVFNLKTIVNGVDQLADCTKKMKKVFQELDKKL